MFMALTAALSFTAAQITEIVVASIGAAATVATAVINSKD